MKLNELMKHNENLTDKAKSDKQLSETIGRRSLNLAMKGDTANTPAITQKLQTIDINKTANSRT